MHGNHLSCKLPLNGAVQPNRSLVLIGNRFTSMSSFPPWIASDEAGEFFTVSNKPLQAFAVQFWSAVAIFGLAFIVCRTRKWKRIWAYRVSVDSDDILLKLR
eukprot:5224399-Amphidinium_carterae.1